MRNRIGNKKVWIWFTLLLIVILSSRYLLIQEQPKEFPMYASNSPSQTGIKAFYTYLKRHNDEVTKWTNSPNQLPINLDNQLLLMIEPHFIPDGNELESYRKFMEAGNTILLFQTNAKGMFELESDFIDSDESAIVDQKGVTFDAEVLANTRLRTNKNDEILLFDDAGAIALKRPFGKGHLIVANAPRWIMNSELLTDDHLELVLKLIYEIEADTFFVDEYIHGQEAGPTILSVYPRWFLLFIVQAAILTALWLWYRGKRFGPIFTPREESIRFSDEGIQALAAWYIRSRNYHDSLVIQADYVKLMLQERWRIPYQREWKDLTDQLSQKWPHMPKSELVKLLTDLTVMLNKETVNKQEYLLWSKRIERIRKEVEEG